MGESVSADLPHGTIVRYTRQWIRNTGQTYSGVGHLNGKVVPGDFESAKFINVHWQNLDEPILVNVANLERDPRVKQVTS